MKKIDILILLTIVMSLITYNLWHVIRIATLFQKSESVFILMATVCIVEAIKSSIYKHSRTTLFLSYLLFSFALNNVLDNLFFNPFIIQLNEYIFAIIALIASFFLTRNVPK